MTIEDKNEIKELLHEYIQGVVAKQIANYDIINLKLDIIKDQNNNFDKRINKLELLVIDLEKDSITKAVSCNSSKTIEDLEDKVRVIQDTLLTQSGIKKWVIASIGLTATVIGIIITILKVAGIL